MLQSITDVLFSHVDRRETEFRAANLQFAHYTTAYVAAEILQKRNVWLRNAAVMNDFLEIQFGGKCLKDALRIHGDRLKNSLSQIHPQSLENTLKRLDDHDLFNRHQTFLTCLTEHDPDDNLGLLSMWRAYGGPVAGVALIFKQNILDIDGHSLKVYNNPVTYGYPAFLKVFSNLVDGILLNVDLVSELSEEDFTYYLYNIFQYLVISTKHQGFMEEREWRLIHSPFEGKSEVLWHSIESVRGVPESVYHIPFTVPVDTSAAGVPLHPILDRIIIGPCQYPFQVGLAFESILADAGFVEPKNMIHLSQIPLRQRD
jgi:hypothetical protein